MKIHEKKKAYRRMLRDLAKDGKINDYTGQFINRSVAKDNSMKRDFFPQGK